MKYNFIGRCNNEIPNTIVLDEAANKWRILLGGLLKVDTYDTMDEAVAAVDRVVGDTEIISRRSLISSTKTPAEWIKAMNVHPSIVKSNLTRPDGTLRIPEYSEWNEDFGLGYANRLAWQRDSGKFSAAS